METRANPRRRYRPLALVATLGIIAAACSGTAATPTPTSPPPTTAPTAAATTAAPTATPFTLPAPEKTTINIGISAPTEVVQFAEKLADQLGYYKAVGFTNVTVTGFEGDGKVTQSLIAGALDFGVIGASSAINSVPTDSPIKVVAMNSVKNTDEFVCTKNIKTAADVKGKLVAVSTFGGTSHGSVLSSLTALGLTSKDVTITQIGNEGARIAALKAGSVGCAPIGDELDSQMRALGFNVLLDLAKSNVQWGRSGLSATADFISKYPNTVLDVVAATLKAQNYIWTNPQDAASKFADWTQTKVADALPLLQGFPSYGGRAMDWTKQAFTIPQQVLATVTPSIANVDVTKAYDTSFLQQLAAGGYYQQIGDPTLPSFQ